MDIQYIHVRDHDGESVGPESLRATGGATIAFSYVRQGDNLLINWACAECLPNDAREGIGDRFIKSIGRKIAKTRLEEGTAVRTINLPVDKEDDMQGFVYADYLIYKQVYTPDIGSFYYPGYLDEKGFSVRCGFDLEKFNKEPWEPAILA